ncbi:MAG: hypothetical protein J6A21_05195 [Lentisphaeria bacterium]|nr:hypothetical protein [Lentisphaeria bacterium]
MKTKPLFAALLALCALVLTGAETEKNLVRNPDFSGKVNEKGEPDFWGVSPNVGKIVKNEDGSCSFVLTGRYLRQNLYDKSVFTPKTDKYVALTVTASGKGVLYVFHSRFTQIQNPNGKRSNKFVKTVPVSSFALSDRKQEFKTQLKIPAGEFCQMLFAVDRNCKAVIEKVVVVEIPAPAAPEKKN